MTYQLSKEAEQDIIDIFYAPLTKFGLQQALDTLFDSQRQTLSNLHHRLHPASGRFQRVAKHRFIFDIFMDHLVSQFP